MSLFAVFKEIKLLKQFIVQFDHDSSKVKVQYIFRKLLGGFL